MPSWSRPVTHPKIHLSVLLFLLILTVAFSSPSIHHLWLHYGNSFIYLCASRPALSKKKYDGSQEHNLKVPLSQIKGGQREQEELIIFFKYRTFQECACLPCTETMLIFAVVQVLICAAEASTGVNLKNAFGKTYYVLPVLFLYPSKLIIFFGGKVQTQLL